MYDEVYGHIKVASKRSRLLGFLFINCLLLQHNIRLTNGITSAITLNRRRKDRQRWMRKMHNKLNVNEHDKRYRCFDIKSCINMNEIFIDYSKRRQLKINDSVARLREEAIKVKSPRKNE
jgi:hypothetical protein